MNPALGQQLAGKYTLVAEIGNGGMGKVFRATCSSGADAVAIKVLHENLASSESSAARFLREARAAILVDHPNVARTVEVGQTPDGLPYLVMELLHGEPLSRYVERSGGRISLDEVITLVSPILSAVEVAHKKGIVHRDLKPDNVFLAHERGRLVPKLLDFGISRIGGEEQRVTVTGATLGTPAYMAPEQVQSAAAADTRSDIWSIGVMMYELLTGELPFVGESMGATYVAIVTKEPPPLREAAPWVPASIARIVHRCLAKAPDERYPNAAELLRDLKLAQLDDAIDGHPQVMPSLPVRQRKFASDSPTLGLEPAPDETGEIDLPLEQAPPPAPAKTPSLDLPPARASSLDVPSLAAPSLDVPSLAAPSLAAPSLDTPSLAPVGPSAGGLDAPMYMQDTAMSSRHGGGPARLASPPLGTAAAAAPSPQPPSARRSSMVDIELDAPSSARGVAPPPAPVSRKSAADIQLAVQPPSRLQRPAPSSPEPGVRDVIVASLVAALITGALFAWQHKAGGMRPFSGSTDDGVTFEVHAILAATIGVFALALEGVGIKLRRLALMLGGAGLFAVAALIMLAAFDPMYWRKVPIGMAVTSAAITLGFLRQARNQWATRDLGPRLVSVVLGVLAGGSAFLALELALGAFTAL